MKFKRSRSSTNNYKKNKRMRNYLEHKRVIQFPNSNSSLRLAIVISYLGTRYNGLQFLMEKLDKKDSKGKSIENVLISAMEKSGYMPSFKDKEVRRACNLLRSCRTDKGVHAASNIVGVRVPSDLIWKEAYKFNLENVTEEIDNDLPDEDVMIDDTGDNDEVEIANIVIDSNTTEENINIQTQTQNDEQVSNPNSTNDETKQSSENIETQNASSTTEINNNPDKKKKNRTFIPSKIELTEMRDKLNEFLPADIKVVKVVPTHGSFNPRKHTQARYYRYLLPKSVLFYKDPGNILLKRENNSKVTEENVKETLERIFKKFEGVHSYHNFTDQVKPGESESFRKIYKITIPEVIEIENDTFFVVQLHGQSFLYHQIRMIMSFAICVCRGLLNEEDIDKCFDLKTRVILPIAPGYPLFLYSADNSSYNNIVKDMRKWKSLDLDDSDMDRVNSFVKNMIYDEIIKIHNKEKKGDEEYDVWARNVELDRRKYFKFEEWIDYN